MEGEAIPYNPSARVVRFFLYLAVFFSILPVFPWFASRGWFGFAAAFFGITVALFLRRAIWKRVLTIGDDSMLVPMGFLRLRPARLEFANVQRVWVTVILGTSILRVRTAQRDIEIQDLYLPDRTVFLKLKHMIESSAPGSHES